MAAHLTLAERQFLHRLMKARKSKVEMGVLMNRHRSTIYRELARNSNPWGYRPEAAHRWARKRREACRRPYKMKDVELRMDVSERLAKAWSPEQIAGRLKLEYPREARRQVSAPTIYAWIKRSAPGRRRWLRQAHRKQYRPFKRPEEVRIEGRPSVINRRRRYGDWEGDTIVSRGRRSGLVTLVERKSGLVRIGLLKDLTSRTTIRAAGRLLANLPRFLRRSTTFDNGPEFAAYAKLSQWLGLVVYFAAPYRAWQRGSNENTNGLVRQFYPKGTDFKKVTRRDVQRVEQLLNDRPRRRLSDRTPNEIINEKLCRN
jgi:transposase, IS30 family